MQCLADAQQHSPGAQLLSGTRRQQPSSPLTPAPQQTNPQTAATLCPPTHQARAAMAVPQQYSRALQLKLAEAGLQGCLAADGFKALLAYVASVAGDLGATYGVLEALKQQGMGCDGIISKAAVEAAIQQQGAADAAGDPADGQAHVTVIDAFSVPRVRYDVIHKRFVEDDGRPGSSSTGGSGGLQPPAQAKLRLYQDRYTLLYQRLRHNRMFAPLNAVQANIAHQPHAQLTELSGLKGAIGKAVIVMGLLSSTEDGGTSLEDEGAVVPVDLTHARLAGGIVTENCVVVAEGQMGHDGVFRVAALGFPGCEARSELPAMAQKLNFFGGPRLSPEQQAAVQLAELGASQQRLLLLSNVWLDRPATFDALHTLFMGFQDAGAPPAMCVMMGNFTAVASSSSAAAASSSASAAGGAGSGSGGCCDFLALREGFGQLARLIGSYRDIKERTRFVFVPGPHDPGLGQVLPQPRLATFFTAELAAALPSAVFATNPCRIKFFSRELVIFRHDLLKAMRRRCLVPLPDAVADSPSALFDELALTLLQQSSLCPLPLAAQPLHWGHAQALSLYPLPHAVVLADTSPQATFRHHGCTVLNPGCLQEGLFAAYLPLEDEVEASELPGSGGGASSSQGDEGMQSSEDEQA